MPAEILAKHVVYIALGTNLGDLESNLLMALSLLEQRGIKVRKVSSFMDTEPYGVTDQPRFLNAVCEAETSLEPLKLLDALLSVESKMGRVRLRHWGERIIDLDLLLYEDLLLDLPSLKLPHPDMQNREFVLAPLAEIAPCVMHPILQKSATTLLEELKVRQALKGQA